MEYARPRLRPATSPTHHSATPTLHHTPPLHHSITPSPRLPPKVWQFDFDPGAPKTNVHRYNSNRHESPSNFYGMPVFYNNRLYVAGGGDIWWGKNEAWLKCLDATRTGDITTNGLVWSYPLQKHVLSTPAVYHGLVFIADMRPHPPLRGRWTPASLVGPTNSKARLGPRPWSPTAKSISARAAGPFTSSPRAGRRRSSAP